MSRRRSYITTTIPYVNGDPHLGFALELVQADVLARHARLRGDAVRLQGGTDDNSLKNVLAAERAGVAVADYVTERSECFAALRGPLQLSFDDFLRTSADPRHRPGVTALWRACAAAGDLYQRDYEGRYCVGCEAFLSEAELVGGRCPEHRTEPEVVAERNWFFRLSRYEREILERIENGALHIAPAHRRNEVLAFVRAGLADVSVSRSVDRARGWGIRVPDDPSQVIYVWFDALGNYISALGYGAGGEAHRTWWRDADRRVHIVGKGVIRFHAVYWPAFLLSAGEPLPTEILVHDYVTLGGEKLSKSAAGAVTPVELVECYGTDALRWWCVRDVRRVGDTDFREELLVLRANELADDLGNLVSRVVSLLDRFGADPRSSTPRQSEPVRALSQDTCALPALVDTAVARFDLREASTAIAQLAARANRLISLTRPWELARAADAGDAGARHELDGVLETVTTACETLARELSPFLLAQPRDAVGSTTGPTRVWTSLSGELRAGTVASVEPPSSGHRAGSVAGSVYDIRGGLWQLAVAFVTGPFRWFQARTWWATLHLALWCVMSWIFAITSLGTLLVSSAAAGVSEREAAIRSSMLHVLAETVGLDLRRIERFCGVRIQPIALGRTNPDAPWSERRRALEQAPSRWRLPAYELTDAIAATALIVGAVAWWWATLSFIVDLTTANGYYGYYGTAHVLGVPIGPADTVQTIARGIAALVGVLLWPTAVRIVSPADLNVARTLLGPGSSELSREVARLSETRTQAVAAAADERRRIERDLHDGFQPQLVNLALNLGLARSRLATDPDSVGELLDRAHRDAKRATEDLRNLVRGIHPSVLDERGLDAAFSALAAGSSVPVQIDVHLERRPPPEVEGITYFLVAEALTNVSKHADAQTVTVTVSEVDDSLWVLVQDDGQGGASPEPGGGLAGLAARIAGVDGTFTVTSPHGGPTWIEALIPCAR